MRSQPDIRERAQAGKDGDPRLYRVHRHLSIHLTRWLLPTRVSADAVTLSMMAWSAAGIALMARPGAAANAAGAALLYMGFLLDKVDGELARCRGTASVRGILLDRLHHRIVEPGLYAAAAIHAQRHGADARALVAAAACMLFANAIEENQQLAPYVLHKHLREGGRVPRPAAAPRALERLHRWLRPLKALRHHVVTLPLVLLAYAAEAATGMPVTAGYLQACAVALGAYLLFQCVDYGTARIEIEARQVAAGFARARRRAPGDWRALADPAAGAPRIPLPSRTSAAAPNCNPEVRTR